MAQETERQLEAARADAGEQKRARAGLAEELAVLEASSAMVTERSEKSAAELGAARAELREVRRELARQIPYWRNFTAALGQSRSHEPEYELLSVAS